MLQANLVFSSVVPNTCFTLLCFNNYYSYKINNKLNYNFSTTFPLSFNFNISNLYWENYFVFWKKNHTNFDKFFVDDFSFWIFPHRREIIYFFFYCWFIELISIIIWYGSHKQLLVWGIYWLGKTHEPSSNLLPLWRSLLIVLDSSYLSLSLSPFPPLSFSFFPSPNSLFSVGYVY